MYSKSAITRSKHQPVPSHVEVGSEWFASKISVLTLLLWAIPTLAYDFAGGTGEPNDPYQIATTEQLISIGDDPNLLDKNFILVNDIDFSNISTVPFSPIGNEETPFVGVFDGQGYAISHLSLYTESDVIALLGYVGRYDSQNDITHGTVKDVHLVDVDITGGDFVAGLVAFNAGTIQACSVTGSITGEEYVGALVGLNSNFETGLRYSDGIPPKDYDGGMITFSHSHAQVTGTCYTGGLVGASDLYSSITDCYAIGMVNGGTRAGGLVGFNQASDITRSYCLCDVTGDIYVGGLVGDMDQGSILSTYACGDVLGGSRVGGLVGELLWGDVSCSYALGDVDAYKFAGGLLGRNLGTVSTCYAIGRVQADEDVGGLIGDNYANISTGFRHSIAVTGEATSTFWNIETSGQVESAGGIGLTTVQMQDINTFLDAGWDIVDEIDNGPNDIWKIVDGKSYPLLAWQKYSGGTGGPNDPYRIATAEDLIALGNEPNDYNDCFVLTADIDLTGYVFDQAVIAPDVNESKSGFQGIAFSGCLDGQGHCVSNLHVNGGSYLGLFGYIDGGIVQDLSLDDVDIVGSDWVGALAGYNAGIIFKGYASGSVCAIIGSTGGLVGGNATEIVASYSEVRVRGEEYVGGLIGVNASRASVSICFSSGDVSQCNAETVNQSQLDRRFNEIENARSGSRPPSSSHGGVVGYNKGSIANCCGTGSVIGHRFVGGLVGYHSGFLSNSLSCGTVDSGGGLIGYGGYDDNVMNCFWDMDTSGQSESSGGIGLNTLEMMDPNVFIEAGWDWLGESDNGTCELWLMPSLKGYPVLSFFAGIIPPEPLGEGTLESPFLLKTPEDLGAVWYRPSSCYQVVNDIDVSDVVWATSVVPIFWGQFEGQGHHIANLCISGGSYLGLFGCLLGDALVQEVKLENVRITGLGEYIGAVTGYCVSGAILRCGCTGQVNGFGGKVGGLVGRNEGRVGNSYNLASVFSESYDVGGLVGINYSEVFKCYTRCTVSGGGYVDGVVGYNIPDAIVSECFRYSQERSSNYAVTQRLSLSEMMDVNNFIASGWDFTGETENGTEDLWIMPDGGSPELSVMYSDEPIFSQGEGSEEAPYIVETSTDLQKIWERPSSHYQLGCDLNLDFRKNYTSLIPAFVGALDGQGYAIRGLTLLGNEQLGLFGCLQNEACVLDLELSDVNVVGLDECIGAIAGENYGTISGCKVTGSVKGDDSVGGLVGCNEGLLLECDNGCNVSGTRYVGGLLGENEEGMIVDCFNYGLVQASKNSVGGIVGNGYGIIQYCSNSGMIEGVSEVGGIIGQASVPGRGRASISVELTIANCSNLGSILGVESIGGIVGEGMGEVYSCYNAGIVEGHEEIGGLVGQNDGLISDSYNVGLISGGVGVGGLAGDNNGELYHCYNAGIVDGNDAGGLIGYGDTEDVLQCFWDVETSGQIESYGGIGLTIAEMQNINTYLDAGWDFVDETTNGTDDLWWMQEGDYPRLWWETVE